MAWLRGDLASLGVASATAQRLTAALATGPGIDTAPLDEGFSAGEAAATVRRIGGAADVSFVFASVRSRAIGAAGDVYRRC